MKTMRRLSWAILILTIGLNAAQAAKAQSAAHILTTQWAPPVSLAEFTRVDHASTKLGVWAYQHPGGAQAFLSMDPMGKGPVPSDPSHPVAMQFREYEIRKITQEIQAAGAPPRRTANQLTRIQSPPVNLDVWFDAFLITKKSGDEHVLHWFWSQSGLFWRLRINVQATDKLTLEQARALVKAAASPDNHPPTDRR